MKKISVILILMFMVIQSGCGSQSSSQSSSNTTVKATESADVKAQETNVVDKDKVKVGDKIAGLTVKSYDISDEGVNNIVFSGQVKLEGTYEFTNTGDGQGYIFTVTSTDVILPVLKDAKSSKTILINNTEEASQIFTAKKGKAKIVLDKYSLGLRQVMVSADLIKVDGETTAKIQETNVVDESKVRVGDKIAGLTVKSIDMSDKGINNIVFSGQAQVEGNYEFTDTGDGDGYIFTFTPTDAMLPRLKSLNANYLKLSNTEEAAKIFTAKKGKAKIVIDNYSMGQRQIPLSADLIKADAE